jgi:hypothetical protein
LNIYDVKVDVNESPDNLEKIIIINKVGDIRIFNIAKLEEGKD